MGQQYLVEIIQPFLTQAFLEEQEMETFHKGFELDPQKMGEEETPEGNLPNLLRWVSLFLDKVFTSVASIPTPILHVCVSLKRAALAVFPTGTVNALSGFFFLRFVCPMLTTPENLPGLRSQV